MYLTVWANEWHTFCRSLDYAYLLLQPLVPDPPSVSIVGNKVAGKKRTTEERDAAEDAAVAAIAAVADLADSGKGKLLS